ncbi:Nuclear pore complex protein Nup155 (155 kDa nucleoporin) (Nucleoporin Nup155) [Durusdinium trenchii]|uniref:Nuclear pore complex protein Nup155 (155 kDa nucleoporin) (Nucleoporin Nup155) n=1 Tax=Durusdinium trenchii TaxID=1381693 RepID=A0ABP0IIC7_9DINO
MMNGSSRASRGNGGGARAVVSSAGPEKRGAVAVVQDEFDVLEETAKELGKVASEAKQSGQESLELSDLLKNSRDKSGSAQQYFVDKFSRHRVPGVGLAAKWLPAVQVVDCRPVPRAIRSLYSQIECETFMGIFPEINRAWITIDNRLFLWNYYKDEDFYMYDGLDQLIVSVGLARPRPGVFDSGIEYVLVISTPVEIVLLKLRIIGDPVYGDISLEPTEFNLASDNVPMRSIAGTADGRIFMAGHDGSLYEFVYEAPGMMHSLGLKRQCRKIELSSLASVKWLIPSFVRSWGGSSDPLIEVLVDHDRGLMYTLSDKSSISLYRLGKPRYDGESGNPDDAGVVYQYRLDSIQKAVTAYVKNQRNPTLQSGIQAQDCKAGRIVSLSVVSKEESESVHLVAITHTGIRIYLTTRKSFVGSSGKDGETLAIFHIRGPPNKTSLENYQAIEEANRSGVGRSGLGATQGGSTSLLSRNRSQQQVRSGGRELDAGIPPGPTTASLVSAGFYAGGVTLVAFAPSGGVGLSGTAGGTDEGPRSNPASSQASLQARNTDHLLASYATDLSMRFAHDEDGFLPAFPPLRWKRENFHEVVDADVLEQGPTLRQSYVEQSGSLSASALRAKQSLPMGRVWAMVERKSHPDIDEEEESVHAHMLHAPLPRPVSKPDSGAALNGGGAASGVGSKRKLTDTLPAALRSSSGRKGVDSKHSQVVMLTELAKQHVLPRRYFLTLTSQGLWTLVKNPPINQLHALLEGPDPGTNADIEEFFKQYGLDESCAMCLAIACQTGFADGTEAPPTAPPAPSGPFADSPVDDHAVQSSWVSNRATLWFRRIGYGIANLSAEELSPQMVSTQPLPCFSEQLGDQQQQQVPQLQQQQHQIATPFQPSSQPLAVRSSATTGGVAPSLVQSGCFMGISLHLSRLLRPTWEWTVTMSAETLFAESHEVPLVRCRWTPAQITRLVAPMCSLRKFLSTQAPFMETIREFRNGNLSSSHHQNLRNAFTGPLFASGSFGSVRQAASMGSSWQRASSGRVGMPRANALSLENLKLAQLFELLDRSIQALMLFEIVQTSSEIQFGRLLSHLSSAHRTALNEMTWGDMVTSRRGKLVACALVKVLVERSPQLVAHALMSRLEKACPSFFSEGDALQLSAFEELSSASQSATFERKRHLSAAVERLRRGFEKTASLGITFASVKLSQETLREACGKIVDELKAPDQAVELALFCAARFALQPLDVMPLPRDSQQPQSQSQDGTAAADLSLEMRSACYQLALDVLHRTMTEQRQLMRVATESQDALWHFELYGWLLREGWKQALLDVDSPFIARFLEDPKANNPLLAKKGIYEPPFHVDMHLLLKVEWLANHRKHLEAALVMQRIAKLDVSFLAGGNGAAPDTRLLLTAGPGAPRADSDTTRSEMPLQGPNLGQRIRYLTRALTYAKASHGGLSNDNPNVSLDASTLQDELEVANLQQHVLFALEEEVQRLRSVTDVMGGADNNALASDEMVLYQRQRDELLELRQAAIDDLTWKLHDSSDLYNDYAYKFGLWEQCIEIMIACNYQDVDELHDLYKRLCRKSVADIRDSLEDVKMTLSNLVESLGNKFFDGKAREKFGFPHEFLIQGLEDLATFFPSNRRRHHGGEHVWTPWVLDAMQKVGVPYEVLFKAYGSYSKKIQSGQSPLGLTFLSDDNDEDEWYSDRSKLNVCGAITTLVKRWSDVDDRVTPRVIDLLKNQRLVMGGLHLEDPHDDQFRKTLKGTLDQLILSQSFPS